MSVRFLAVVGAACSPYGGGTFICSADLQCQSGTIQGTCEEEGYCSFPDPSCPSGRRFGDSAAAPGTCVGEGGPDAPIADGPADDAPGAPDAPVDAGPAFCEPTAGLVACYRFENNLLDESGQGNHGVAATAPTYEAGHSGLAARLALATNTDVAESASLDVAGLTIEAWINPGQLPLAGERAGIFDNDGQYGAFVYGPNAELRCLVINGLPAVAPAAVTAGTWTHVACTYDGTTTNAYVNGALVGTVTGGTAMNQAAANGSSIGANVPSGDALVGLIDDLRIWNVPRAPTP